MLFMPEMPGEPYIPPPPFMFMSVLNGALASISVPAEYKQQVQHHDDYHVRVRRQIMSVASTLKDGEQVSHSDRLSKVCYTFAPAINPAQSESLASLQT